MERRLAARSFFFLFLKIFEGGETTSSPMIDEILVRKSKSTKLGCCEVWKGLKLHTSFEIEKRDAFFSFWP